ncbi:secreted aspartic proteinase precursor [Metarhizium acridum CQMa 102]|uniref:Secreted aspartic proteinase n=1 Tax=Metarhizium acridum (strain CQMa 102) TaxID=655827 RepID=E9E2F1_METAQ|nr:secreted aspartic proteinase precursor [Metarhizium acridum CQMa 102]EFY89840.1 secreted aspartic proteinase precursor [Metarhizium acridum CQMa 102]
MQTFGSFLVSLVVASSLAAALPTTSSSTPNGTFSVTAKHNGNFTRSGPAALAKAYRKFGKPVPADVANALGRQKGKRTTGSDPNSPQQYDVSYLAAVQIGTPAQTLNLDFDTGSSDLWVFSSLTPSSQVNGQTVYDPSRSSTAQPLGGSTWSIAYGDGSSSSGVVYTDAVTVGGLTVDAQAVEAAEQVSSQFSQDAASSGLLGLAFSSINTVEPTRQKTFFDNAKPALDSALFTADLKHGADGRYNFGYIDGAAYTGSIAYTAVDSSQGFWGFTSTGYAVGGGGLNTASTPGIADTGTTLLLLPGSIVSAYYARVSGARYDGWQGGYTFACSQSLPSFSFGVSGAAVTVPGAYLNYAPADGAERTCFGGLQSSEGIGINIFGDIALKSAFVVFDGGNNRLGWASKAL